MQGATANTSSTPPDGPDAELQAAFQRHLPQRLKTLMRRARAQCRGGWDCNVLRGLHDEIARLAGACGRYGLLEAGERLLALEAALAPAVQAGALPDAAATARVDTLLDALRPHLQRGSGERRGQAPALAAATLAVPEGLAMQAEVPATLVQGTHTATNEPATTSAASSVAADGARLPRIVVVNDDDPVVSELLLRLEQPGCTVELVESLDAIDPRATPAAELVVLVADSDTDFESLAASLREARRDPGRRTQLLVLLRGLGADLRLHALRAGADRCIVLPTTVDEVLAVANELAELDRESPYRVLILDDDPAQSLFAQAILRRAGMETRVMTESLSVLDELDKFRPDLLLLDLNMPDCDGCELVALVREREHHLHTPIVFLSGEIDEDRQFAALDAGADDFLQKPIRPTHLVAAVTNRIRRARAAAARARRRRRSDNAGGLHERAQLLDALSEFLAAHGGRPQRGGLLAIEVQDGDGLRERLGPIPFDQLLTDVAETLSARLGSAAMLAQDRGAGFLVFLRNGDEASLTMTAAELSTAVASQRFGAQASALQLRCAVCAFDASIGETAIALAALRRTLAAAVATAQPIASHSSLAGEPDALVQHLGAALATGSFGLAFQPVLPIRGSAYPNYQALLRLRVDGHEYPAAELIPVALRHGAIAQVDDWVLSHCLSILARRQQQGAPVRLFANQSVHGWAAERQQALAARIEAAGVLADLLVLEFRGEEVRADPRQFAELAVTLKQAGVGLSLAGVERKTLESDWIGELPLGYVKLLPQLADVELAGAVCAAHARGLRVIAPRIETLERAQLLRELQVDLLQGNYFQAPAEAIGQARPGGAA